MPEQVHEFNIARFRIKIKLVSKKKTKKTLSSGGIKLVHTGKDTVLRRFLTGKKGKNMSISRSAAGSFSDSRQGANSFLQDRLSRPEPHRKGVLRRLSSGHRRHTRHQRSTWSSRILGMIECQTQFLKALLCIFVIPFSFHGFSKLFRFAQVVTSFLISKNSLTFCRTGSILLV